MILVAEGVTIYRIIIGDRYVVMPLTLLVTTGKAPFRVCLGIWSLCRE